MNRIFLIVTIISFKVLANAQLVPVQTLFSAQGTPFLGPQTAGGDSFGGGDSVDVRKHTAWFYGEEKIATCFHSTQNFGLPTSEIQSQLNSVIQEWKNYFDEKAINKNKGSRSVNTNFEVKDRCVGGEDLVFYFGTGPIFSNLSDLRARQSLSRPVAYVNKTHVREDYTWSKGYVRFVGAEVYSLTDGLHFPNWTLHSGFKNLLKHELGHVLGFTHVPRTIMDKNISKNQFIQENLVEVELEIDGEEELISCEFCEKSYAVETSQEVGWEKIFLFSDKNMKFQINGVVREVTIQDVIHFHDGEPRLLSMFETNGPVKNRPHVFFVKGFGRNLTVEVEGKGLVVRSAGEVIARFKREKK